jgi:hypothetical protein
VSGFFEAVLSFPAVLFTPLLVVVIGYWLVVVVGGADPDADGGAEGGLLAFAGFGGVPAAIPLSLLILFAWFGSLAGAQVFPTVAAWLITVGALVVAWVLTRLAVLLLKRLLPSGTEPSRADLLGRTGIIRTGRVTRTFGQAEVHSADGSSAIVQVRQAGDDDLHAGSIALLYDVDPEGEFFWVVPADIATKDH